MGEEIDTIKLKVSECPNYNGLKEELRQEAEKKIKEVLRGCYGCEVVDEDNTCNGGNSEERRG